MKHRFIDIKADEQTIGTGQNSLDFVPLPINITTLYHT
jgi:hypothetical protein